MDMVHWIYYLKLNNISASGSVQGPKGTGKAPASLSSVGQGWPVMAGDAIKKLDSLVALGIIGSERLNIQTDNGQTTYDNRILTHKLCSNQSRNKAITSVVTGPK